MKRTALLGAAALVVAVNGLVLGRVVWNRAGAPDASMTLTERELPVAFSPREAESSAISLRLEVSHVDAGDEREDPDLDVLKWLNASKLEELGFDVRIPSNVDQASERLSRQLERNAYVAVEFQGPAWKSYRAALERSRLRQAGAKPAPGFESWQAEMTARELRNGSRLFIVDAGLDPVALRELHADRSSYLVLPATIAVSLDRRRSGPVCQPGTCRVRGMVWLVNDEVAVPHRLHSALPPTVRLSQAGSREADGHDPSYEVTLRTGALHEPWVESIRPLSGSAP